MAPSKKDLWPQARVFYVRGLSVPEIAASLGVSTGTIYRWKKLDRKAGIDWDTKRGDRQRYDPQAILNMLKAQFAEEVCNRDPKDSGYPDRIYKLDRVIERHQEAYGDFDLMLNFARKLSNFALEKVSDDRREVMLEVIDDFIEEEKRSAS